MTFINFIAIKITKFNNTINEKICKNIIHINVLGTTWLSYLFL